MDVCLKGISYSIKLKRLNFSWVIKTFHGEGGGCQKGKIWHLDYIEDPEIC